MLHIQTAVLFSSFKKIIFRNHGFNFNSSARNYYRPILSYNSRNTIRHTDEVREFLAYKYRSPFFTSFRAFRNPLLPFHFLINSNKCFSRHYNKKGESDYYLFKVKHLQILVSDQWCTVKRTTGIPKNVKHYSEIQCNRETDNIPINHGLILENLKKYVPSSELSTNHLSTSQRYHMSNLCQFEKQKFTINPQDIFEYFKYPTFTSLNNAVKKRFLPISNQVTTERNPVEHSDLNQSEVDSSNRYKNVKVWKQPDEVNNDQHSFKSSEQVQSNKSLSKLKPIAILKNPTKDVNFLQGSLARYSKEINNSLQKQTHSTVNFNNTHQAYVDLHNMTTKNQHDQPGTMNSILLDLLKGQDMCGQIQTILHSQGRFVKVLPQELSILEKKIPEIKTVTYATGKSVYVVNASNFDSILTILNHFNMKNIDNDNNKLGWINFVTFKKINEPEQDTNMKTTESSSNLSVKPRSCYAFGNFTNNDFIDSETIDGMLKIQKSICYENSYNKCWIPENEENNFAQNGQHSQNIINSDYKINVKGAVKKSDFPSVSIRKDKLIEDKVVPNTSILSIINSIDKSAVIINKDLYITDQILQKIRNDKKDNFKMDMLSFEPVINEVKVVISSSDPKPNEVFVDKEVFSAPSNESAESQSYTFESHALENVFHNSNEPLECSKQKGTTTIDIIKKTQAIIEKEKFKQKKFKEVNENLNKVKLPNIHKSHTIPKKKASTLQFNGDTFLYTNINSKPNDNNNQELHNNQKVVNSDGIKIDSNEINPEPSSLLRIPPVCEGINATRLECGNISDCSFGCSFMCSGNSSGGKDSGEDNYRFGKGQTDPYFTDNSGQASTVKDHTLSTTITSTKRNNVIDIKITEKETFVDSRLPFPFVTENIYQISGSNIRLNEQINVIEKAKSKLTSPHINTGNQFNNKDVVIKLNDILRALKTKEFSSSKPKAEGKPHLVKSPEESSIPNALNKISHSVKINKSSLNEKVTEREVPNTKLISPVVNQEKKASSMNHESVKAVTPKELLKQFPDRQTAKTTVEIKSIKISSSKHIKNAKNPEKVSTPLKNKLASSSKMVTLNKKSTINLTQKDDKTLKQLVKNYVDLYNLNDGKDYNTTGTPEPLKKREWIVQHKSLSKRDKKIVKDLMKVGKGRKTSYKRVSNKQTRRSRLTKHASASCKTSTTQGERIKDQQKRSIQTNPPKVPPNVDHIQIKNKSVPKLQAEQKIEKIHKEDISKSTSSSDQRHDVRQMAPNNTKTPTNPVSTSADTNKIKENMPLEQKKTFEAQHTQDEKKTDTEAKLMSSTVSSENSTNTDLKMYKSNKGNFIAEKINTSKEQKDQVKPLKKKTVGISPSNDTNKIKENMSIVSKKSETQNKKDLPVNPGKGEKTEIDKKLRTNEVPTQTSKRNNLKIYNSQKNTSKALKIKTIPQDQIKKIEIQKLYMIEKDPPKNINDGSGNQSKKEGKSITDKNNKVLSHNIKPAYTHNSKIITLDTDTQSDGNELKSKNEGQEKAEFSVKTYAAREGFIKSGVITKTYSALPSVTSNPSPNISDANQVPKEVKKYMEHFHGISKPIKHEPDIKIIHHYDTRKNADTQQDPETYKANLIEQSMKKIESKAVNRVGRARPLVKYRMSYQQPALNRKAKKVVKKKSEGKLKRSNIKPKDKMSAPPKDKTENNLVQHIRFAKPDNTKKVQLKDRSKSNEIKEGGKQIKTDEQKASILETSTKNIHNTNYSSTEQDKTSDTQENTLNPQQLKKLERFSAEVKVEETMKEKNEIINQKTVKVSNEVIGKRETVEPSPTKQKLLLEEKLTPPSKEQVHEKTTSPQASTAIANQPAKKTKQTFPVLLIDIDKLTKEIKPDLDLANCQQCGVSLRKVPDFPMYSQKKPLKFLRPKSIINISPLKDPVLRKDLNFIPSVTKVLASTLPNKARNELKVWRNSIIKEFGESGFKSFYKAQITRGSQFHKQIEEYLAQNKDSSSTTAYFKSLRNVLKDVKDLSVINSHVVHKSLSYRGVVDCVANYRGKPVVMEWKRLDTNEEMSATSIEASALQMSAYVGALNFDENYKFQITGGIIAVAYSDGSPAQVIEIMNHDCEKHWKLWLHRLKKYHEFTNSATNKD